MNVAGIQHSQAPWFWPQPSCCSSISPKPELQAESRPGNHEQRPPGKEMKGFLHRLPTEAKLAVVSTPESVPTGQSSTLMWAVHKDQTKYPATWAQVSKANQSGTDSLKCSQCREEGKGMCPPAPRLSFVPQCQSWEGPARTGRQTGIPSDCMP